MSSHLGDCYAPINQQNQYYLDRGIISIQEAMELHYYQIKADMLDVESIHLPQHLWPAAERISLYLQPTDGRVH